MFIEVNRIRLNTVSFGADNPIFLAISGFVGSWEVWLQPFELMSNRWRCISYDHRGAGESPVPPETITKNALVDDLFAVMDAYQVKHCILGGESMGGVIALLAVLRQPERFKGLVLIGSDNPNPEPLSAIRKQFVAGLRANYHATIKTFVDLCIPEPNSEHLRRWGVNICLRAEAEAAARLVEIGAEGEMNVPLNDVMIPTLVIHGTKDAIIPMKNSEYLASVIPNSELVVIDGVGHVPTVTRPNEVVVAIERRFGAK